MNIRPDNKLFQNLIKKKEDYLPYNILGYIMLSGKDCRNN